jgi:lipopolysaccharide transport system ATP-binding protein
MSYIVIKVENLSKQYRIGAREAGYRTFRETIMDAAKAPFLRVQEAWGRAHRAWSRKHGAESIEHGEISKETSASLLSAPGSMLSSQRDEFIWALKNISFEVKRGEVVGIIGRNGAGKSTLLKILSKITEPTEGRVELRGRIGSLLEVGTGFHPELTGHENVYLYGAILGMNRWEITRKFDEIVAFAELERFIDTPVKRYSSGMYMRLAFAVAAHLEPEILLVDEVLAVGDAQFQKKCLGKMSDVSSKGRTVLFVSHNMAAVNNICQRAVVLDLGNIVKDDNVDESINHYLQSLKDISITELEKRVDRQGDQSIKFISFQLTDFNGNPLNYAHSGQDIALAFEYECLNHEQISSIQVDIGIHGKFDENLIHLSTKAVGANLQGIKREGIIICKIPNLPLQPGRYSFNIYCVVSGTIADWVKNAGIINVEAGNFFKTGRLPDVRQGVFLLNHSWHIE